MSLIFQPGSFFAARAPSFLPRASSFKIAASAFAAGALMATVAANAPHRSPANDVVGSLSRATRDKPVPVETKAEVIAAAPVIAPPTARATDASTSDTATSEPDNNVGTATAEAVPSPRPKPDALVAAEAPASAPTAMKPGTLAALITKLNADDANGVPAPETADLTMAETSKEPAAAPQPVAEAKHASEGKPAPAKRVAAKRAARADNSGKPLNLAEMRAQTQDRSSAQPRNLEDRRVTVWQRPAEESSPLAALGNLFGSRF